MQNSVHLVNLNKLAVALLASRGSELKLTKTTSGQNFPKKGNSNSSAVNEILIFKHKNRTALYNTSGFPPSL